jgi:hypothetical protein
MADFATVAELETFMGTSSLGARGTAMLGYASAEIRRYTGQDIEATAGRQEEFAGGLGRHIISLAQTPVTAVSAITENAVVFTDYTWTRWGDIHRDDWTTWDTGPVIVTYDSGYASTEDEFLAVKSICLEVAARAMSGSQAGQEIFGDTVPELRGAAPAIFLTPGEERRLDGLAHVMVA